MLTILWTWQNSSFQAKVLANSGNSFGLSGNDVLLDFCVSVPGRVTFSLCDPGSADFDTWLYLAKAEDVQEPSDLQSAGAAVSDNNDYCGKQSQITHAFDETGCFVLGLDHGYRSSAEGSPQSYVLAVICEGAAQLAAL